MSSASGHNAHAVPLVVDLDGTLVRTDTLHEGVLRLLVRSPQLLLQLPTWLAGGKAAFKREIATRQPTDAALLPFNAVLLERLQAEREARPLVLCTAADASIAEAVAAHTGLFSEVLSSDGASNLAGQSKGQRLVDRFGVQGFDYAGNALADLPVFAVAREAWIVTPTVPLGLRASSVTNATVHIGHTQSRLAAWFKALRPHQWIKNILVFIPLLTAVGVDQARMAVASLLAFVAFSAVASGVYLVNDMIDIDADRVHPRKRRRPIAAGTLPVVAAVPMAAALLWGGFVLAWLIAPLFAAALAVYLVVTSLYMLWLKRVPILDSIVLATLYTMRLIGGAAAIAVVPSFWLLAFSIFFFMSLALGKRHAELVEMADTVSTSVIPGRGYRPEDLHTLIAQGNASGYAAVVVLALYLNDGLERHRYQYPELLAPICLLLLYWLSKFWLNSQRREIHEDPVIWALTNRVSRGIAALTVLLLLLARWLPRPLF